MQSPKFNHRSSRASNCRQASTLTKAVYFCVFAMVLTPVAAPAQGLVENFTGFTRKADAPISIEADRLDIDDKKKTAIFTGNVIAGQEGFAIRSRELQITYRGGGNASGGTMSSEITRVQARHKVLITSQDNQSTSSDWADFDVAKNQIVIGGNVTLTQGDNILKCGTMAIDLNSGRTRCNTRDGRVRGVFNPKKGLPRSRDNKTN